MNLLCLVKIVPDVDDFRYDPEKNGLVRDNVRQILNPEDATALALAFALKKAFPETWIETVSMGPRSVLPHLEDLLRRGANRVSLISDSLFTGSDTYVTSRILARYIATRSVDWIFSGTHSLDGGTAHVPAQVAETLGLAHMGNIVRLDRTSVTQDRVTVDVDSEEAVYTFAVKGPAILGFAYAPQPKLPYIAYEDVQRNVQDRISCISNAELGFAPHEVGARGSLTKVGHLESAPLESKNPLVLRPDAHGVEQVYQFLAQKGFVKA